MQQLWENGISKAAKLVLDGDACATVPSMEEMIYFWTPILATVSKEAEPEVGTVQENPELQWIAAPITCKEIQCTEVPLRSAPKLQVASGGAYPLCFERCFTIHS